MTAPAAYRGTITREQWLFNETRIVARLLNDDGLTPNEAVQRCIYENLFQYPTERELRSIARACCERLGRLSDDPTTRRKLIRLIAHGTAEQAAQTNLYAMMCTFRVVWEFMTGVIGPKYQSFDFSLTKPEIVNFLEGLRAQDETVASWSDATLNKIRQVFMNCLANAGFLENARSHELLPVLLDLDLENGIRANGDTAALPAFNCFQ